MTDGMIMDDSLDIFKPEDLEKILAAIRALEDGSDPDEEEEANPD